MEHIPSCAEFFINIFHPETKFWWEAAAILLSVPICLMQDSSKLVYQLKL